jgi:hypothetical protein
MDNSKNEEPKIRSWTKFLDAIFPWNGGTCRICRQKFKTDEQWHHVDGLFGYQIWRCNCKGRSINR